MSYLMFAARAALLFLLALSVMPMLSRAPASARRFVLAIAFAGALVMPLATGLVPFSASSGISIPVFTVPYAEPLSEDMPAATSVNGVTASSRQLPWRAAIVPIWMVGAILVLARVSGSHIKARRLANSGSALERGVVVTDAVTSPAVVGAFRPTILLPRTALEWSEARLRVVLLHERAHVAQRDGLLQLVAQVACAVYWFVPFAWLASRRLRRECEIAADARVVASGVRPTAYAEHLLAVAQTVVARDELGAAVLGMASEISLRVHELVRPMRPSWSRARVTGLGIVFGTLAAAIACTDAAPRATGSVALRRSIDTRLQTIVDDEATRTQREWEARAVTVVIVNPATGEVLASTGAADQVYVPGSTVKALVIASALEDKLITEGQQFDCANRAYGSGTLYDAIPHGVLDIRQILAVSSNVGASRVFDLVGGQSLARGLRRFHMDAPGVRDASFEGAVMASGLGFRATPLQIAAAYGALADGVFRDGYGREERVLGTDTARAVRLMLEEVVHGERGTGKAAAVSGVRVAGKTGTSNSTTTKAEDTFASFVGLVPSDAPRFVIYVGVDAPKGGAPGGKAAAPAFARIASRALR